MNRFFHASRVRLAATAGLSVTLAACAQQVPPPENGEQRMIARMVNGQVEMIDARDGTVVVAPQGLPLFDPKPNAPNATPKIELQPQPDGFDLLYRFTAQSSGACELGKIQVGIFNLGQQIHYRDFRYTGEQLNADYQNYVAPGNVYPGTLYSPVGVFGNSKYTIGVTLQYPVLSYGHDVRTMMRAPGGRHANGPAGRGWAFEYRLSNFGDESGVSKMFFPGSMMPGESRTYVISVRVTDKHDEWQRTLLPYRNFFQNAYGPVRYKRDASPVNCHVLATNERVTADNPLGFAFSDQYRPDLVGWKQVLKDLNARDDWPRLMLWMAGGNYQYERDDGFHFTTRWLTNPKFAEATDPALGLPSLRTESKFGLWWSQSILYSRKRNDLVGFDRTDSRQTADAWAQLELAAKAGAKMIGLDTFHNRTLQVKDHYRWLEQMTKRYPDTTFVTEPITNDITHTLSPTFLQAWSRYNPPRNEGDLTPIKTPHYLADFLNPGHEIWGCTRYHEWKQFKGRMPTEEEVRADMAYLAKLGFAPAVFTSFNIAPQPEYMAAETWKTTVPADLRQDADRTADGGNDDGRGSGPQVLGSGVAATRGEGNDDDKAVSGWKPGRPTGATSAKSLLLVKPTRAEAKRAIERMNLAAPGNRVSTAGDRPSESER